jgi:hypothetical protein
MVGGGHWRGVTTGAERVGGCCLFIPGGKSNDKKLKIREAEPRPLVATNQLKNTKTNQKTVSVVGGVFEMRRYCGGTYGGEDITSFGRRIN